MFNRVIQTLHAWRSLIMELPENEGNNGIAHYTPVHTFISPQEPQQYDKVCCHCSLLAVLGMGAILEPGRITMRYNKGPQSTAWRPYLAQKHFDQLACPSVNMCVSPTPALSSFIPHSSPPSSIFILLLEEATVGLLMTYLRERDNKPLRRT